VARVLVVVTIEQTQCNAFALGRLIEQHIPSASADIADDDECSGVDALKARVRRHLRCLGLVAVYCETCIQRQETELPFHHRRLQHQPTSAPKSTTTASMIAPRTRTRRSTSIIAGTPCASPFRARHLAVCFFAMPTSPPREPPRRSHPEPSRGWPRATCRGRAPAGRRSPAQRRGRCVQTFRGGALLSFRPPSLTAGGDALADRAIT